MTVVLTLFHFIFGFEDRTLVLNTGVIAQSLLPKSRTLLRIADRTQLIRNEKEPHFRLELDGGTVLESSDYQQVSSATRELPGGATEITLTYRDPKERGPEVEVVYSASKGRHYCYKKLRWAGPQVVRRVVVDRWTPRQGVASGGLGQPIFVGREWFLAVEHPVGIAELRSGARGPHEIELYHYPGKANGESFPVVLGCRTDRDATVEDAFERYLNDIRRPQRPWLVYNTWYDQRGTELTPVAVMAVHDQLRHHLLRPFDLSLDAFVIDDGWQDPQSLWQPNPRWKSGLADFRNHLNNSRSHLGLWLPLNGQSLDTAWGESQGFERSDFRKRCYCLAGERYQKALKTVLKEHIETHALAFLKHDFNYLKCSAEGHGHLPTPEHGREANTIAQMELLSYIRGLRPDIGLAVTSNAWPSPFWLMQADFIWMGSSDYAENTSVPSLSKRQAEMTFRDSVLYRLAQVEKAQIPLSSLMTHGMIKGVYEGSDADRNRDWWDAIALQIGRGTLLQELYLSPKLLTFDEQWEALGHGLRWARHHAQTLAHTRMIGGNPNAGDVYGYAHWSKNMGIICLRNPSPKPTTFPISTVQRPKHLERVSSWTPIIVYPHRERLAELNDGSALEIPLLGFDVVLLELHREVPVWLQHVPVGRFIVERRSPDDIIRTMVPTSFGPPIAFQSSLDRTEAKFTFSQAGDIRRGWLRILTQPADGLSWNRPDSGKRVSAPNRSWELWTGEIRNGEMAMSLPFSPFFPMEARTTVVARTERLMTTETTRRFPYGTVPPLPEPEYRSDHRMTQELVLIDDHGMHRRRSSVEILAWLVVLVGLPSLLGFMLYRVLARESHAKARVAWAIIAMLALIYVLTPLGSALGRTLSEL